MCKEILRKNNLNPIKRLGKGGFGLVYLVSKTDFATYETELFSVKCINKKNFVRKPVLRRYLKQEIMLLENLHHPNIVKLIRTFEGTYQCTQTMDGSSWSWSTATWVTSQPSKIKNRIESFLSKKVKKSSMMWSKGSSTCTKKKSSTEISSRKISFSPRGTPKTTKSWPKYAI